MGAQAWDERCTVCHGQLGVGCNLEGRRPDCPGTQFLQQIEKPIPTEPDPALSHTVGKGLAAPWWILPLVIAIMATAIILVRGF